MTEIDMEKLEEVYASVKWGELEPWGMAIPYRTYVAIRILQGYKYPRKMKKWAIGTRKSDRRWAMQNAWGVLGKR